VTPAQGYTSKNENFDYIKIDQKVVQKHCYTVCLIYFFVGWIDDLCFYSLGGWFTRHHSTYVTWNEAKLQLMTTRQLRSFVVIGKWNSLKESSFLGALRSGKGVPDRALAIDQIESVLREDWDLQPCKSNLGMGNRQAVRNVAHLRYPATASQTY